MEVLDNIVARVAVHAELAKVPQEFADAAELVKRDPSVIADQFGHWSSRE